MADVVQVAAFSDEIQMSLIRNNLENRGIETYVKDEHVNALKEFSVGGLSGVKLMVKKEDYQEAIDFLIEIGHYKPEDFEPSWLEKWLFKIFGKK